MMEPIVAETITNRAAEAAQYEKDILYLHPSEHSSLALTSTPLDGTNFLAWQRAVYVSLETKMKLGFIDGSFPCPAVGSIHYEQWRRVDLTVTSWIWNSMSKDIVEAFMYCATSRELWTGIQRRIMKLWNEITCLPPPPKCKCGRCICGVNDAISESIASSQLMQFLHESYNNERSKILMLDPLPDIERAFAMVYAMEKQRAVHIELDQSASHMECQLTLKDNRGEGDKSAQRKKQFINKRNVICSHCRKSGHTHDACFQLHGVPDWYKVLNDKKKKGKHFTAVVDDKQQSPEFASNTSSLSEIDLNCWIIDSGATNHICANIALFQSFIKPSYPHFIHLPDGSKRFVSCIGVVKLTDTITLDHVLFIPEFSVNLLSISQLCRSKPYVLQFTRNSCIWQDHETKESMVLGVLFKKLYVFQQYNSHSSSSLSVPSTDISCSSTLCNYVTWHNRLGHASLHAIKHIPDVISIGEISEIPCDACHKAKQTRIPFPVGSSSSLSCFDLVHLDP
ncbi:UNVERIFIED_CONTAM: hypothetical protein Slati_0488700 [Sesamum latifolium]|uniref:Retrotransposon Copia-like N-terminal domain-containing protein n=1 Tax=Sesamum latifolium TaxID=2727402 RepID=A0AAW2XY76_9LAMI